MEEFKPNSYKSKEEIKKEDKKIEKIVSTPVTVKKKGIMSRIKDEFCNDTEQSLGEYIVFDILIPAAKSTISDLVKNSVDMMLGFGSNNRQSNVNRVSYRSYYESGRDTNRYSRNKNNFNYDEIILQNRGEAESVLSEMDDIIRRYGKVRVSDLYDLVGVSGNYTDNSYGWTDLRSAKVNRVRDGYLLEFPRPMPID